MLEKARASSGSNPSDSAPPSEYPSFDGESAFAGSRDGETAPAPAESLGSAFRCGFLLSKDSSTSCVSGNRPCSTHTSPMDSTRPVKCRMSPSSSMNSGVTARKSMSPRCTLTRYRPLSPRSVATGWSITGDFGATTAPTARESSIMPSSVFFCRSAVSALPAPPGSRNGDAIRMYAIPLRATGTP